MTLSRKPTYGREPIYSKQLTWFATLSYTLLRIFLGGLFTFSGFVKAIDPLGTTYKIEDYLKAFGGFFEQIQGVAFSLSVALSTFELLLGLCFVFSVKIKSIARLSFLLMLFMLPLTLFIAMTNPVTDCGCFGDAVHITNWQTFYKNILITIATILLMILSRKKKKLFLESVEWIIIALFVLGGVGLSIYSYMRLPMIDFRPYKVGVNIPKAMEIPDGVPLDKYQTTLIYSKNGVEKTFQLDNYPKDSTWKFVQQKTILVEKGYTPPIQNFSISTVEGEDITDSLLHHRQTVDLIIIYDLKKASSASIDAVQKLYEKRNNKKNPFLILTATDVQEIETFRQTHHIRYPICIADPITLKTMIRATPGWIQIKNGTIINKLNWRNFQ